MVALEPRSNTMKMGIHRDSLAASLDGASLVFVYRPEDLDEQLDKSLVALGSRLAIFTSYDDLVGDLERKLLAGDQMVFMSNGGFGAARQKLTMALQKKRLAPGNPD